MTIKPNLPRLLHLPYVLIFALLASANAESFKRDGPFFTPSKGSETKVWNIPVPNNRVFQKIVLEMDVTPASWWSGNPDGVHNLFWLTRQDQWRSNTIGYVNLFGAERHQFKQMTNLGLDKGEALAELTDYQAEPGKTFHLSYTYDCLEGTITSVIEENGVQKARLEMPATAKRIATIGGFYRLWIGLEEQYNECPTIGWTYSNLDIRMEPAPTTLLKTHSDNPRYFEDGGGHAILLSGVNNGWELQDNGFSTLITIDWEAYLDYLDENGLNYIRLWRIESTRGNASTQELATPMPYHRTGSDRALDGKAQFDLDAFNQAYFDRMRDRCLSASERGMYVCIMLFEKHSSFNQRKSNGSEYPWKAHPFHPANNLNGVSPDIDRDGNPREIHHLSKSDYDGSQRRRSERTLSYQKAYIRKVIDTTHDLENVIYEICNEALPDSESDQWQAHLANYAKQYQLEKPLQHLIGFTGPGVETLGDPWPALEEQMIDAVAFVSPRNADEYRSSPPETHGRKIIFADSDHINPFGRDEIWVWKSFLRGYHPQALEAYGSLEEDLPRIDYARDRRVRESLGLCLDYAHRIDLATLIPRSDLSSAGYCLANPGFEYLALVLSEESVTLTLQDDEGEYLLEWLNIETGDRAKAETVKAKKRITLSPPGQSSAIAWLKRIGRQ
jgi:hypothetical protein